MPRLVTKLLGLSLLAFALVGCQEYSKVVQGRVVEYDKEKKVATIIKETSHDRKNPIYDALPPVVFKMPTVPIDMGPEPKAGGRIRLDAKKNEVVVYDPTNKNAFKSIPFTPVEMLDNIDRGHPLVVDPATGKPKSFPIINKEKKTVTVYSPRQKYYATIQVSEEALKLPEHTWVPGDEIRLTYKEDGQAIRFMNITRTDIFKK